MKQAVSRFLVLCSAIVGTACQRPGGVVGDSGRILWNNSKAHDAQSYLFLLNPYWARERVEDHIHQSAYHVAIVGEWYLLTTSADGDDISLTGYYVHGNTGAIEYRVARHNDSTYPAQPKHLQFDSVKVIAAPMEHRVYWAGNTAYKAYVPRLNVSLKEARAILNKHDTSPSYLQAVVDDWYVFSRPGDRSLSGYYVNASNGAIEHRTARHNPVDPPQQPGHLRFMNVSKIDPGSL